MSDTKWKLKITPEIFHVAYSFFYNSQLNIVFDLRIDIDYIIHILYRRNRGFNKTGFFKRRILNWELPLVRVLQFSNLPLSVNSPSPLVMQDFPNLATMFFSKSCRSHHHTRIRKSLSSTSIFFWAK